MAQEHAPAVGTSIVLSLDGQKVTGRVTAVQADKFVVRLPILQPAKAYQGLAARTLLPGGAEVQFDLGGAAYYSELLIEVPLPGAAATPRPVAQISSAAAAAAAPPPDAAPAVEPPVAPKAPGAAFRAALATETSRDNAAVAKAAAKPALNKALADEPPPPPPAAPAAEAARPAGDERRRYFRFAFRCHVDVVENVGHVREFVRESGTTINLSGGGMLVEFDRPVPPGVYRFRLQLPEGDMVLSGRAIKKDASNARISAIEFIDLSEGERSKLIRFIFTMMRQLKQGVQARAIEHAAKEDRADRPKPPKEKGYLRRQEKYFRPTKIRYW